MASTRRGGGLRCNRHARGWWGWGFAKWLNDFGLWFAEGGWIGSRRRSLPTAVGRGQQGQGEYPGAGRRWPEGYREGDLGERAR